MIEWSADYDSEKLVNKKAMKAAVLEAMSDIASELVDTAAVDKEINRNVNEAIKQMADGLSVEVIHGKVFVWSVDWLDEPKKFDLKAAILEGLESTAKEDLDASIASVEKALSAMKKRAKEIESDPRMD